MNKFSERSKAKLATVDIRLQNLMNVAIKESPYDFSITEGIRTLKRQKELVAQGKSKTLKSYHLKGKAVDIGVIVDRVYKGTWKDFHYYQDIYNIAKDKGLLQKYNIEWGGNCWRSFKDAPHWQIKGADKISFR